MNWLAHLHLSPPDGATRVGNLLPDLLPGHALAAVDAASQAGIALHQRIDAFTDHHPVFLTSVRRVPPELRRYGRIIMDVLYDHLLCLEWSRHCAIPRAALIGDFHSQLDAHLPSLPALAAERLAGLRDEDLLSSYAEPAGIAQALARISTRLRRPVALEAAVGLLDSCGDALLADFSAFYPEMIRHVVPQCSAEG